MKPIYPIKTFILLAFMLLFTFGAMANEFDVKSFEKDENDLAARRYDRMDINGEPCALVKIKTDLDGLGFESGVGIVGDVGYKEGQYWVYLVSGERRLSIYKKDFIRMDYSIPLPVESYDVFHMVLTAKGQKIESLPVTFQITPSDAQLTVDGESIENDQPVELEIGEHRLLAERENYQPLSKTITVNKQNVLFNFEMDEIEDAGVIITSKPAGAKVTLDGVSLGVTPVSTFYPVGRYPIKLSKDGYVPIENEYLEVKAPKTKKNYTLEENVGYLTITTNPNATVTMNGKKVQPNERIKLNSSVVNVEVTMPKAETLEESVVIKHNDDKTIELMPDIQTGTIQVAVTPTDAKIELNSDAGKCYSATGMKVFSDIPVGAYRLKVIREGYKTDESNLTLHVNEKLTQSIKLEEGPDTDVKMIFVKGGCFDMGCASKQNDCDNDEKPLHRVCVDDFYISKTEVTHVQYIEFLNETGVSSNGRKIVREYIDMDDEDCAIGYRSGKFYFKGSKVASDESCPVIEVSWYGAKAFAEWTKGRLPTEAEWEYAARGGNKSREYKYAGSNNINNVAWNRSNSGKMSHVVGSKRTNELGLYDMSGNVWEWCSDLYDSDYYENSLRDNPQGPKKGRFRILRGGSWNWDSDHSRITTRIWLPPEYSGGASGFRIAR